MSAGGDAGRGAEASFEAVLGPELRSGDDRSLWIDVLRRVAFDVAGLERVLTAPPRHVVLAIVRIRAGRIGGHPDDRPTLRLAWERDRGDPGWRFAGTNPRVRSHHGCYTTTVCVPGGTIGLGWVEVVVLWRPHLPTFVEQTQARRGNAPAEDHETGRQSYRYRREADGSWRFLGVHEGRDERSSER
jgi:hypothetical protein